MNIGMQNWRAVLPTLVLSFALIGCGGSSDDPAPNTNPDPAPDNQAPTVSIGELAEAQEQAEFTLTATAQDSDGIGKYEWTHDSSLALTLSGEDSDTLTVKSPDISEDQTVTFTITVTDDNANSKTAQAQQQVVIKRRVSSVTITGIVTDNPIANADVTVRAGESSVQVKSGTDGSYTAALVVDESETQDLVQIKAVGTGEQSQVEFWSLLNSVETVIEQAGDDGVLQKDENFSVNVTNVSTAEYALISREGDIPTSDEELNTALLNVDANEKLQLATLIKVVVDNPEFSLPEGVSNTLQLVENEETAQAFEQQVNEQDPTIIEKTKEEIKKDDDLVTGPSGSLVGSYIMQSPRYYLNTPFHLTLNDDSTGEIISIDKQQISSWVLEGNELRLTFAAPVRKAVSENKIDDTTTQKVETFVSAMNILILGENDVFRTIEVTETEYDAIDGEVQPSKSYTYFSNLTDKSKTAMLTSEALIGTWYLDISDKDFILNDEPDEEVSVLTFNADGSVSSDLPDETITWALNGTELKVDYKGSDYEGSITFWLTKKLDAGFQVVTLDMSDDEWPDTEFGLLIKKNPDLSITDNTIIGRWQGFVGQDYGYYMDIYSDGAVYFGMQRSKYTWERENDLMYRRVYHLNGQQVENCNLTRDDCNLVEETIFEFLAIAEGHYYVHRTFRWLMPDGMWATRSRNVVIYRYTTDLTYSAFDELLLQSWQDYGELYVTSADGNSYFAHISSGTREVDGEQVPFQSITLDGQSYDYELIDGKVVFKNAEQAYIIEVVGSAQDYLEICIYIQGGSCADEGKGKIWKKMPLVGQYFINNSDYFTGEVLDLNLSPWRQGKISTEHGEFDVNWDPSYDSMTYINLYQPAVINSMSSGADFIEEKLVGYTVSLNYSEPSKVEVTKRVERYTNGSYTSNMDSTFSGYIYYDRDFIDLSGKDFVGKWVTYDRFDGPQIGNIEFNADGTGNAEYTFDQPDESTAFEWEVQGHRLILSFGEGELDTVFFTKDLTVGYQYVNRYEEMGEFTSSQPISGLLIKDMSPELSKDDYLGRWTFFDGVNMPSMQNGTEIYPEPDEDSFLTFVFGTQKSNNQGRYVDGQVLREQYFNPQTYEYTRLCTPNPDTCVKQREMRYHMVAEHDGVYYWAREFSNFDADGNKYPSSGVMFVSNHNPSTDIQMFEEYHVAGFYLYEVTDSSVTPWSAYSYYDDMGEKQYSLNIGSDPSAPFTFSDGKMHLQMNGQDMVIELVPGSNTKDGLTICKYQKEGGECTEANHINLQFESN